MSDSDNLKERMQEEKRDFFTSMYNRKIICRILRKFGDEFIQVEQKKVKMKQRTFRTREKFLSDEEEYIIQPEKIIWEKAGLGRRMVLYYELGKKYAITFDAPKYFEDAMTGATLTRRKAFTSLLNKMDTILLIGMIVAIIGMVASIGLYIYGQTQSNAILRENTALVRENTLLKEQLGIPQVPTGGNTR